MFVCSGQNAPESTAGESDVGDSCRMMMARVLPVDPLFTWLLYHGTTGSNSELTEAP